MRNQHGLSRHIPADVTRDIRKRSKFGCVICRSGFYEYEHIDPAFVDAREHDSSRICCLCPSCHSMVTLGQKSKASVASAYAAVQSGTIEEVGNPKGPLDFYGGNAELRIGGLSYSPTVRTVFRYHGSDVILVEPGEGSLPGRISAIFTDDTGEPTLVLNENVWEGSTANWDIQVVGNRISVKTEAGRVALRIRLDPPGVVVIEQLDMRLADAHLLVTEDAYAVGRYVEAETIAWMFSHVGINGSTHDGCAIEFAEPDELKRRYQSSKHANQFLSTNDENIVICSGVGILWIPAGIAVASLCGDLREYGSALGVRPLDGVRQAIRRGRQSLMRYIGSGVL